MLTIYIEEEEYEKSYYSKKDILKLYELVQSHIKVVETYVIVYSTIRIPTVSTVGDLFTIKPFPIFDEHVHGYVTVSPEHSILAVNKQAQYIHFNKEDLSACETGHSLQDLFTSLRQSHPGKTLAAVSPARTDVFSLRLR